MKGKISMILTELHYHTSESSPCGRVPARKGLALYKAAGYDAVVITDHFSRSVCGRRDSRTWEEVVEGFLKGYQEAKKAGEELGLRIYLGMELRFPHDENDFLVYGLTKEDILSRPWLYEKELSQVYEDLNRNGIQIYQAHPFRRGCTPANPQHVNGIEVLNGNPRHDSNNHMAAAWAKDHNLPGICGSDFHQVEDLVGTGVYFESLPDSEKELARLLREGDYTIKGVTSQTREPSLP